MTIAQYWKLKRLYPNADETTLFELQRQLFLDSIIERQQAEAQGKEYAQTFVASFEKELEKLFK